MVDIEVDAVLEVLIVMVLVDELTVLIDWVLVLVEVEVEGEVLVLIVMVLVDEVLVLVEVEVVEPGTPWMASITMPYVPVTPGHVTSPL